MAGLPRVTFGPRTVVSQMTNSTLSILPPVENPAVAAELQLKAIAQRSQLLIVDDDPAIRELASDLFKDAGYRVMTAADGHEALRRIGGTLPDLVITDLHMPRMSGFELLIVLRERFPQIPVIAVSGEYKGDALPPGVIADVYLSKDAYATPRFATTVRELLASAPMRQTIVEEVYHPSNDVAYHDGDLREVLRRLARSADLPPQASAGEPVTAEDDGRRGRRPSAFATSTE